MFLVVKQGFLVIGEAGTVGTAQGVAGNFRPVTGDAHRHILGPVQIDADPDRQTASVVELPGVGKQQLQPLRDAGPLGQNNKVVLGKMPAVLMTEITRQNPPERLKKAVALGKAVFLVIKLHAVEVNVEQDRVFVPGIQPSPAGFRQFEEIAHAGKPRQVVVKALIQHALTPDGPAERAVQRPVPVDDPLPVFPLIRIPDIGKLGSVACGYMFSHGMDQAVAVASAFPAAVDDVVSAASCRKQNRGL